MKFYKILLADFQKHRVYMYVYTTSITINVDSN